MRDKIADKLDKWENKVLGLESQDDIDKKENVYCVKTSHHMINAKYVVLACHYPIINAPRILLSKNVPRSLLLNWLHNKF